MELEELNRQKLVEELKSIKATRLTNLVKSIAMLIGGIILFILITRPEFLLNKKISQEDISRERAKLILSLIKEKSSYEDRILALSVIEKAYPLENKKWINNIKEVFLTNYQKELNKKQISAIDSNQQKDLYKAKTRLDDLLSVKEGLIINKLSSDYDEYTPFYKGDSLWLPYGRTYIKGGFLGSMHQIDKEIYTAKANIQTLEKDVLKNGTTVEFQ